MTLVLLIALVGVAQTGSQLRTKVYTMLASCSLLDVRLIAWKLKKTQRLLQSLDSGNRVPYEVGDDQIPSAITGFHFALHFPFQYIYLLISLSYLATSNW